MWLLLLFCHCECAWIVRWGVCLDLPVSVCYWLEFEWMSQYEDRTTFACVAKSFLILFFIFAHLNLFATFVALLLNWVCYKKGIEDYALLPVARGLLCFLQLSCAQNTKEEYIMPRKNAWKLNKQEAECLLNLQWCKPIFRVATSYEEHDICIRSDWSSVVFLATMQASVSRLPYAVEQLKSQYCFVHVEFHTYQEQLLRWY